MLHKSHLLPVPSYSKQPQNIMACPQPVFLFLLLAVVLSLAASFTTVSCQDGDWDSANATSTFNGQDLAGCGFENQTEYKGMTVAVSAAMYENGKTCGACFEIRCNGSSACLPKTIQVTAAKSCAASYFNGTRNWCQEPRKHFELPTSIFSSISNDEGAVVPVQFRRVTCDRQGGMRFRLLGSGETVGVMVYNVGGTGEVVDVKMKGDSSAAAASGWVEMINGDDQRWVTADRMSSLSGQSLSFRVTSSNGTVIECMNVAPKDWKFGESYEGDQF
uniref:Expansin n=1 Tax=Kalanchoe fedtschenkoi TaxID=63787 RepID=A0A7N0ZVC9_KALFE